MRLRNVSTRAVIWSTSARAPADAWACWTPPSALLPSASPGPGARNHRGRRRPRSPFLRGLGRRPAAGARDLIAAGFGAGRRSGGDLRQRPNALCAGRGRQGAAKSGALTCGISCAPDSELSARRRISDRTRGGPGDPTGSTRLRAGTATKLVLNMISTAVMIRLGHVYGNLMVNVQPTNGKLRIGRGGSSSRPPASTSIAQAALLERGRAQRTNCDRHGKARRYRAEAERILAAARQAGREASGGIGFIG